ncbi:MAG TPA: GAF and ANTAR domain-containing protein, partial [Cryptosporangiaceae bacterium]|nr:GAF and ANTAR domain-containing protein [Cryptosporangiaceae bacterium]
ENGGMTHGDLGGDRTNEPSPGGAGEPAGDDGLATRLSDIARSLQEEDSAQDTLQAIVDAAVGTVPGAELAGISLIEGRQKVRTPAATDPTVEAVDQAQYETGEGPCLDALYEHRTIRLPDMAAEARWPKFTARIAGLGVHSMLSFQLFVAGDNLGALNLYARTENAFDDESDHIGLLFASHAAVALAGAQREEQLVAGMHTRDLIGQAKGILMERYKLTGDQAFALLIRSSQTLNVKLREVAEELTRSGEIRGVSRRRE